MNHLANQDWNLIAKTLKESYPFSYCVLDNFLLQDTLNSLRSELIRNPNWQHRNIARENKQNKWVAQQIFNNNPQLPLIYDIIQELKTSLPYLFFNKSLLKHWAILCYKNEGIFPHCDGGKISLNIWLTPNQFNESPNNGGLILFDVKRTNSMSPLEYSSEAGGCVNYVNQNTKGHLIHIPYYYNRAILFDAWTFHATDIVNFTDSSTSTARLNLTFSFDVSAHPFS